MPGRTSELARRTEKTVRTTFHLRHPVEDAFVQLAFAKYDTGLSTATIGERTRIDVPLLEQLFEFKLYPWRLSASSFLRLVETLGIDLRSMIEGLDKLQIVHTEDMSYYPEELRRKQQFAASLRQYAER